MWHRASRYYRRNEEISKTAQGDNKVSGVKRMLVNKIRDNYQTRGIDCLVHEFLQTSLFNGTQRANEKHKRVKHTMRNELETARNYLGKTWKKLQAAAKDTRK